MACRGSRILSAALIVVVSAVVASAPAPARPLGARTFPSGCGDAVKRVSSADEGAPVLLVHGFAGGPSDFRHRLDLARPSMLAAVRDLDGVAAYTFDYSTHSLEWVTDPAIGRALGRAIVCLAERQGAPVTVVAHSMGGLAAREAQGVTVRRHPVADSLAAVITVGTPFHGAQLLGFADGPGGDVLSSAVSAALRACGADVTTRPDRSFCDLLGATETAAVQAMIPGSDELSALPPWADRIRIVPMAAEIEVGIDAPFGFSEEFSIGDFAVSAESALADASRAARAFVARCHASLFSVVSAIDESPCSHTNELANRRIIEKVRDRVERSIARTSRVSAGS